MEDTLRAKGCLHYPRLLQFPISSFPSAREVTLNAARHFRTLRREIKIPRGELLRYFSPATGQTGLAYIVGYVLVQDENPALRVCIHPLV